jgi:hypothetical protein
MKYEEDFLCHLYLCECVSQWQIIRIGSSASLGNAPQNSNLYAHVNSSVRPCGIAPQLLRTRTVLPYIYKGIRCNCVCFFSYLNSVAQSCSSEANDFFRKLILRNQNLFGK